MTSIKKLLNILPIIYDNRNIDILTPSVMDAYVNELRKEYYNKYADFDYRTKLKKDKLQSIMYNFSVTYLLKIDSPGDARMVLTDSYTHHLIGGCTLFEKDDNNTLEISYFIKPEFQQKGEALNMLNHIIKALKNSDINFNLFRIVAQQYNIASIKLADKLGFKKIKEYEGVYTTNYVYELER